MCVCVEVSGHLINCCLENTFLRRKLGSKKKKKKKKKEKKKFILKDEVVTKPAVSVLFILVSPYIRSKYLTITAHYSQSATHLSTPVSSLRIFPH